jgi:Domain of unknown function (DUF1992)
MTERKPAGISFTSWIDQQIAEAAERGAFDDLPGAGRPLPKRHELDGETWIRDWVRREGGSPQDCLPTPLKLRREIEQLTETVGLLPAEQQVRESVAELNQDIRRWRALPLGPPIFVPLVDEDAMVARWRDAQPGSPPAPPVQPPVQGSPQARPASERRRWWRRRRQADSTRT